MFNEYLKMDLVQLNEDLKDTFQHTDSRSYMYTRSYLQRLCKDQLEGGNVSLKAFILAYDNISSIMLTKGALAEYSQVEMILAAHPRDLRAKAVMKLQLDPRDPLTFKYDKLSMHDLEKCATTNSLTMLDLDGARTAPVVTPYFIPAGVLLPHMPVVVYCPAIPNKGTPVPVQAMEEIPITGAKNMINVKMGQYGAGRRGVYLQTE